MSFLTMKKKLKVKKGSIEVKKGRIEVDV